MAMKYINKLTQAGINVTGWVSREKVLEYLTNSKIYLSTAKWEGMPVSIIQKYSCDSFKCAKYRCS